MKFTHKTALAIAAVVLAVIGTITGLSVALASSGSPAASAPASAPASLPSAYGVLTQDWYRAITDVAMPPGMTAEGVVSAAYGVGVDNTHEQVILVYDTPAHAAAGAAYLRGQLDALGVAYAPGPDQIAHVQVDQPVGDTGQHAGPTVAGAFGTTGDMTRLISQISGGNA